MAEKECETCIDLLSRYSELAREIITRAALEDWKGAEGIRSTPFAFNLGGLKFTKCISDEAHREAMEALTAMERNIKDKDLVSLHTNLGKALTAVLESVKERVCR